MITFITIVVLLASLYYFYRGDNENDLGKKLSHYTASIIFYQVFIAIIIVEALK